MEAAIQNPFQALANELRELKEMVSEALTKEKKTEPETDEFLTIDETAAYLKVKRGTIHNMVNDGRLVVYKVGARSLFLKDEVKEFVLSTNQLIER